MGSFVTLTCWLRQSVVTGASFSPPLTLSFSNSAFPSETEKKMNLCPLTWAEKKQHSEIQALAVSASNLYALEGLYVK